MKYLLGLVIIILLNSSAGAVSSPFIKQALVNHKPDLDISQSFCGLICCQLNPRGQDITMLKDRKLTLKERIALIIFRRKLKHQGRLPVTIGMHDKGKASFILGLVGAICLLIPVLDLLSIPFSILAIVIGSRAKKDNRMDKKARIGVILGIVTLGVLVFVGLIVAIILTIGSVPR